MKDIKVANPAAGIGLIEPPTANSRGTANLHYPIEVPPGRRGLQPQLSVAYSSNSANGWMGLGWDLQTSNVEVDTRFGFPSTTARKPIFLTGKL